MWPFLMIIMCVLYLLEDTLNSLLVAKEIIDVL